MVCADFGEGDEREKSRPGKGAAEELNRCAGADSGSTLNGFGDDSRAAAIAAARRGWSVFPCLPDSKRPAVPWTTRAVSDAEIVARCWPSPRHNVGVACGPSGLVVLDLDTPAHGGELPPAWRRPGVTEGADVLAVLLDQHGDGWPDTYSVRTPTNGTHLYFLAPPGPEVRNSAGRLGPMIDVRATGGYVVGAGSTTSAGAYVCVNDRAPAPLPGWLADLLTPRPAPGTAPPRPAPGAPAGMTPSVWARLRGLVETVLSAPHGQRNNALHWAACRAGGMVAAGLLDEDTAFGVLSEAALSAGLDPREVGTDARNGTIGSGLRRGQEGAS